MNFMNKLFAILLCKSLVFALPTQAQNMLKGTILNESDIGVSSATVSITTDSVFVNDAKTFYPQNFRKRRK